MKVYISDYRRHWFTPYTWIEYAFFWTDWSKCARKNKNRPISSLDEEKYIEPPEWVEEWADKLSPISRAIQKVLDFIHPKINYVKIDRWDTWSMDHTLSYIILPMLKQLNNDKHGAPYVDDEDVPDELKSTSAPPKENEHDTDANHFKRWDYVMNEMIFAFEHKLNDEWENEFCSGETDYIMVPVDKDGNEVPKGQHSVYQMKEGPNHTYKCDWDEIQKVHDRIKNGFRLFGKYYQGLWD